MELMARKYETICRENAMTLVRCDSSHFGSSLVIGPYSTIYSKDLSPCTFSIYVDVDDTNMFRGEIAINELN
jgi:hypothetical protein